MPEKLKQYQWVIFKGKDSRKTAAKNSVLDAKISIFSEGRTKSVDNCLGSSCGHGPCCCIMSRQPADAATRQLSGSPVKAIERLARD